MDSSNGGNYLCLDEVYISMETYMEDFKAHLLPSIKPEWEGKKIASKVFDSGITNELVALFRKERGLRGSGEDVILLRVNGQKTEEIINRTDEIHCILTLHEAGLCPSLHARLGNGLCYGFSPGDQVTLEEVREEGLREKIAKLMARLHCVRVPEHFLNRAPQLWAKVSWLLGVLAQ